MPRASFLGLWVEPALDRAIRAYALERRMTRSEAVRALLRGAIAELSKEAQTGRHGPNG
jgi:hypothetical protein